MQQWNGSSSSVLFRRGALCFWDSQHCAGCRSTSDMLRTRAVPNDTEVASELACDKYSDYISTVESSEFWNKIYGVIVICYMTGLKWKLSTWQLKLELLRICAGWLLSCYALFIVFAVQLNACSVLLILASHLCTISLCITVLNAKMQEVGTRVFVYSCVTVV